jgi:hypothetical protein
MEEEKRKGKPITLRAYSKGWVLNVTLYEINKYRLLRAEHQAWMNFEPTIFKHIASIYYMNGASKMDEFQTFTLR